jgi:hypothetical protein
MVGNRSAVIIHTYIHTHEHLYWQVDGPIHHKYLMVGNKSAVNKCWNCGASDHISRNCPTKRVSAHMHAFMYACMYVCILAQLGYFWYVLYTYTHTHIHACMHAYCMNLSGAILNMFDKIKSNWGKDASFTNSTTYVRTYIHTYILHIPEQMKYKKAQKMARLPAQQHTYTHILHTSGRCSDECK